MITDDDDDDEQRKQATHNLISLEIIKDEYQKKKKEIYIKTSKVNQQNRAKTELYVPRNERRKAKIKNAATILRLFDTIVDDDTDIHRIQQFLMI